VIPSLPGLPADPRATTPSSVVITPQGTLYVSSVFTGIVSEFTRAGTWLRDVFPLSPVAPVVPPVGRTPYGLAVTSDGSLWIANLGIVVDQPAPNAGSVIRVRFTNGQPAPMGDTMRSNLNFPDGLGVYNPR
jgi:streptogramin lyase